MSSPITTVVFDVGNVLIEWDPRHLFRKVFLDEAGQPDEAKVEWFLTTICTQTWNECQDVGRGLAEGTQELLSLHPEQEEPIRAYYDRFQEMIPGEIPGAVALLRRLKERGSPVFGLSNYTRETFRDTRERFDFFRLLDGIVVSGEEGVMKPDPEIYQRLLARFGLESGSTLFIDDNLANIEAARALGFATYHFDHAEGLAGRLATLRLL